MNIDKQMYYYKEMWRLCAPHYFYIRGEEKQQYGVFGEPEVKVPKDAFYSSGL